MYECMCMYRAFVCYRYGCDTLSGFHAARRCNADSLDSMKCMYVCMYVCMYTVVYVCTLLYCSVCMYEMYVCKCAILRNVCLLNIHTGMYASMYVW